MKLKFDFSSLVPSGFSLKTQKSIKRNGLDVVLYRYERTDAINSGLMGEHCSLIIDGCGALKGFASIQQSMSEGGGLNNKFSEIAARNFLAEFAPDLLRHMEVHWVRTHDEKINIFEQGDKKTIFIRGAKVKCRNVKDGLWFWVIVNDCGVPFVFERDVVWINFPGIRKTEKWLDDHWIKNR